MWKKKTDYYVRYWFCEGLGTLNDPTSEHRKKQMDASVILADKKWFLGNEKSQC